MTAADGARRAVARRIGAWTAGLWLWAAGALAQDPVAQYTLDDCIRIGLERSGVAANARRDQAIADTLIQQVRAEAIPQVSLNAGYTRLDELQAFDLNGETTEVGTLDNYSAGTRLSQLLYAGGKVRAAVRAARLSQNLAAHQRSEVESALVRDIRLGFYNILLAQAAVAVGEESVAQLQALLDQTQQRLGQGAASEFEVLNARVRLGNQKPDLIRAVNALDSAVEDFRRLLNLGPAPYAVNGALEYQPRDFSRERLQRLALEHRAALRMAEDEVGLREQDLAVARTGNRPTLKANAGYNGANSYGFASFENEWQWHWTAGLTAEWEVWDGGLTAGRSAEKRLELEKSRTRLDELRKSVLLEVRQAFLDLQSAREAIAAGEGIVEQATKAMEIMGTRYRAGLATQLEYADANVGLSEARLTHARALHVHLGAEARLKYACGTDEVAAPEAQK